MNFPVIDEIIGIESFQRELLDAEHDRLLDEGFKKPKIRTMSHYRVNDSRLYESQDLSYNDPVWMGFPPTYRHDFD